MLGEDALPVENRDIVQEYEDINTKIKELRKEMINDTIQIQEQKRIIESYNEEESKLDSIDKMKKDLNNLKTTLEDSKEEEKANTFVYKR